MPLGRSVKHPSCPSMSTYRGDLRWVRQLRTVGLIVPLVFVVGLQALHLFVLQDTMPYLGEWGVTAITAGAAILFGVAMFHLIQQGHRILLVQNRELGALNVVSDSLRGTDGVDGLVNAAMGQVMALTQATAVTVTAEPLAHAAHEASSWHRGGPGHDPGRDHVIPLLAGNDPLGTLTLHFAPDAPGAGLSSETLHHIGQQVGGAMLRARLVENLAAREQAEATLRERDRIARELHDSLAQVLGVTHLRLRATASRPELAGAEAVRVELDDLADLVHDAYADVREAILGLREAARQDRTLLESLEASVATFTRLSGVDASFHAPPASPELTPEAEAQTLRIVQEALTNIRKHAGARRVEVRVAASGATTVFSVQDDGKGFDPAASRGQDHFGLSAMRDRADSVRGRLEVASRPGAGTRVTLTLPADAEVA